MKKLLQILILSLFTGSVYIQAKLYTPDFERSFRNQIKRHDLAVVHFNPFPVDEENEPELEEMKAAFISLSKDRRYKNADVAFIGVNLNNVPDLAKEYNIDAPNWADASAAEDESATEAVKSADKDKIDQIEITKDQESTFMLFKEGKPFQVKGKIVKQTGFMTETEMEDFIEAYFGDFIDTILEQKKSEIRQRQQERQARRAAQRVSTSYVVGQPRTQVYRTRVYPRYYPSYGYYRRPYGGYWGGYSPWGRGYYGRGWGFPGFGLGFGFGGRRGGFGIGFGW